MEQETLIESGDYYPDNVCTMCEFVSVHQGTCLYVIEMTCILP